MKAIQIMMDPVDLQAIDQAAKQTGLDRSKFIRKAVARLLAEMRRRELEATHRRGYVRKPQRKDEVAAWEELQAWPEE
ncbi:MAG: ribbon-helix-helix protein, CopG family [Myxococcota bacterium]